jgi:superfamily I DNA/RNA helicase
MQPLWSSPLNPAKEHHQMPTKTRKLRKTSPKTRFHLSIRALAGTGKTTTLCWAVNGVPNGIVLSQEQEPIIKAIQTLIEANPRGSIRFTAFSKAIQKELESRLPETVDCCTNHSLGLRMCREGFGRVKVETNKVWYILTDLFGDVRNETGDKRKKKREHYNTIKNIVSIAKATLAGDLEASQKSGCWVGTEADLRTTCEFYSVEYTDTAIFDAMSVLEECSTRTRQLDFDDMIWLPAIHDLRTDEAYIGIIDEFQDCNAAQLWIATHTCQNLITIGDVNQSIFGFAGADPEAIRRGEEWMESNGSFAQLPLNQTRRCGKAIVEECQDLVPSFEAHEDNNEGAVTNLCRNELISELQDAYECGTDLMVLCRTNAPLTRLALELLKHKIPVQIRGRQFAQGIIRLINSFSVDSTSEMLSKLEQYEETETNNLMSSERQDAEQKLLDLQDKCLIVRIFSEGCASCDCIVNKFNEMFSDDVDNNVLTLSSAHRSKGLEADQIYIIEPQLLPHPKIAEKSEFNSQQEHNLAYVARSRAKKVLTYVHTPKDN